MRFISLVLLLVLFVILSVQGDGPPHLDLDKAPELFEKFIKDYNRHYKDDAEKHFRYELFKKKLAFLNLLNDKGYPVTTFGINGFADQTEEETKHFDY